MTTHKGLMMAADIADELWLCVKATEKAHYRVSPHPFDMTAFGYDYEQVNKSHELAERIRHLAQEQAALEDQRATDECGNCLLYRADHVFHCPEPYTTVWHEPHKTVQSSDHPTAAPVAGQVCTCTNTMQCEYCRKLDAANIRALISPTSQAERLAKYQKAAPLCAKHKPSDGARSGCLVCALEKLSYALSRISYACEPPNEMECSEYDVHCNENEVVKQVQDTLRSLAGKEGA